MSKIFFLSVLCLLSLPSALSADDTRDAESLIPKIVHLLEAGQFDAAGKMLDVADRACPDNDAVQYYKGELLLSGASQAAGSDNQKLERILLEAESCFEKALSLDSTNLWYAKKLGILASILNHSEIAEKQFVKILKKNPYDSQMLSRLAELYLSMEKFRQADSLITRVEMIEGDNEITRLARMELFFRTDNAEAFFKSLEQYIVHSEASAGEKCRLLRSYMGQSSSKFINEHTSDYESVVEQTLSACPGDSSAVVFAVQFYFSEGKADKALELCEAYPDRDYLVYSRYVIHMNQENFPAALKDLGDLEKFSLGNAEALSDICCMKGDIYQRLESTANAIREYKLSIKLNPDNIVALNNYAYYLSCMDKDLSKCLKMSKKVIDAEPKNPTYLDTYGWVLYKQKKYAQAKMVFKLAIVNGGKSSPEILMHYSKVLEALNETALAESYRSQAEAKMKDGSK